jgi:two-component system chemotaxis response regulator CheB
MLVHDIIVIGASAGGVETLIKLVKTIPANIKAAIFVVVHISPHSVSSLPNILQRHISMLVSHAKDGEAIKQGRIYIAPPDYHLLIKPDRVQLTHGPKENRHRPAADPLFRSAAQVYRSRVIGVVLSGTLDDGTAGLFAIKQQGGIAIVQDPEEAIYDGMPRSAIENVSVDYVLPIAQIGTELFRLSHKPASIENKPVEKQLAMEADIADMDKEALQSLERPGKESPYSCPECGGVLWEIKNQNLLRFRCRTGHAFSSESLFAEQSDALEQALWVALRALKEQSALSRRLAARAKAQNHSITANRFEERAQDVDLKADIIRRVLMHNENQIINSPTSTENDNLGTDIV